MKITSFLTILALSMLLTLTACASKTVTRPPDFVTGEFRVFVKNTVCKTEDFTDDEYAEAENQLVYAIQNLSGNKNFSKMDYAIQLAYLIWAFRQEIDDAGGKMNFFQKNGPALAPVLLHDKFILVSESILHHEIEVPEELEQDYIINYFSERYIYQQDYPSLYKGGK